MRLSINVRVLGYIQSCPEAGKIEFTIIERETIGDVNSYKALMDNGVECDGAYKDGTFTACC